MKDGAKTGALKPAAAYLRRSTDRQEQSLGDQRKGIEAYAERAGYDILDWYADDAISGAGVDDRQAFLRMIHDAQQPSCPFKFVLVYDVKRFGRLDNDETGYFRYLLRKAGVEVVYVAENLNGDDTDDLLLPVKQWQARQELRDLSKVTIRGLLSKVDGGWWMGGTPPYGYDLAYCNASGEFLMAVRLMRDGSKQVFNEHGQLQRVIRRGDRAVVSKQDRARLVLSDPERVETVREIFHLYVRNGFGFKKIADCLNQKGLPSPRNGRWSKVHSQDWSMTTVRDILRNPAYTGDAVWNRRSLAKFHRISGNAAVPAPKVRRRAIEDNDEKDWIVTRGTHPAIIPRKLFEKAQKLRTERSEWSGCGFRSGRGARSNYLLTGVIVCDQCGHRWQGYTANGGKKRIDGSTSITEYYACGGYVMKGSSVCQRQVIRRGVLEELVLGAIEEAIETMLDQANRPELRRVLQQYLGADKQGAEQELATLRARRDAIRAKINNILDNITSANREFADERIGELKKELMALAPRIEELEQAAGAAADLDEAAAEMVRTLQSLSQALHEGSTDERRMVVRAFVREIRLHPGEGTGRAETFSLPEFTLNARHEPAIASPAGPGLPTTPRAVAETVAGHTISFDWSINQIHVSARADANLPVACSCVWA